MTRKTKESLFSLFVWVYETELSWLNLDLDFRLELNIHESRKQREKEAIQREAESIEQLLMKSNLRRGYLENIKRLKHTWEDHLKASRMAIDITSAYTKYIQEEVSFYSEIFLDVLKSIPKTLDPELKVALEVVRSKSANGFTIQYSFNDSSIDLDIIEEHKEASLKELYKAAQDFSKIIYLLRLQAFQKFGMEKGKKLIPRKNQKAAIKSFQWIEWKDKKKAPKSLSVLFKELKNLKWIDCTYPVFKNLFNGSSEFESLNWKSDSINLVGLILYLEKEKQIKKHFTWILLTTKAFFKDQDPPKLASIKSQLVNNNISFKEEKTIDALINKVKKASAT